MTWGYIGGAAVGVIGSAMSSDSGDKNGGAGASSQSKDPWLAAQPWMQSNIAQGQNLQGQYARAPFNQAQLDAYGNMGAQSDYMRNLIPGLLGTASRQQNGFDRSNPNARPEAYNFNPTGGQGGLLGSLTGRAMANYGSANPAPQAPQQDSGMGTFVQATSDPLSVRRMQNFGNTTGWGAIDQSKFTGGYGEFKYGQPAPEPGTKAYRDMQEYFAYGGADPYSIYGKGQSAGGLLNAGPQGGPGAGGVGAAGGAGAGASAGGVGW